MSVGEGIQSVYGRVTSFSNVTIHNNNNINNHSSEQTNQSLLSSMDSSPESSFKRSPPMDSRPLLLTASATNLTPNKRKKYVHSTSDTNIFRNNANKKRSSIFATNSLSDKLPPSSAHTLPLLDDDNIINNNLNLNGHHHHPNNRVLHRSLVSNLENPNHPSSNSGGIESTMLSRRFSADDTNQVSPIQTYVVLHEASHDYQFFNENNMRSSHLYSQEEIAMMRNRKNRGKTDKKLPRKKLIERLNFDNMETEIYHKEWKVDHIGKRGIYKWLICLGIGILTALCMYLITIAIQFMLNRVILNHTRNMVTSSWYQATLYYLGCNIICALIAALSVIYIERAAAGSGIPEVKAYLNGSWIPHLFNIRTLFVKLFGVTFAVSGSFIIGKEGPMVHAGSIIANGISRGRSRTLGFDCNIGYTFRNDRDARNFISCGAAAGVAAAFGAPVGGMLFALEEISSFWQGSLTWRSFFCAAISAFFLDVLLSCFDNNEVGTCGEFTRIGLITFNSKNENQKSLSQYNALQLIAFLIIGICGGLIGALFNYINIKICYVRKRIFYPKSPKLYPIIDVLFACLMTTFFIMIIPQFIDSKCKPNSSISGCQDNGDETCHDITEQNQFSCPDGYFNGLSALLLGEREQIIKYIFHYDSKQFFEPIQLFIACITYFILAVYTYGLSIPSGLFIPLILIGSTFGWFFGYHWELWVMTNENPYQLNTYALMGASGLLGGSTRMTISLTAIILEITNDIYYLLPIMLVVMISKWIGDRFNAAIYETHVALSNIPYLEHSLPKWIPSYLCAKDIMTKNVMCLPIICPLRILNRYLRDPNKIHNAFPIIDCDPNLNKKSIQENYTKKDGKFVGIMLRWHIMIILSKRNFAPIDKLSKLQLLTLNDLTDSSFKNKYISSYQHNFAISLHELNTCHVDFSPYMHLSPFTVQLYTPIHRVYTLFRGLGLRHLLVLDTNNKYIDGIITTNNLSESNLEHAVNKLYQKIEKNDGDDYVCHRIQQMNQSQAIKKYKLSKRFRTSTATTNDPTLNNNIFTVNNNNNSKIILSEHTEDDQEDQQEEETRSISGFSIAKNEKDMRDTIDVGIDDVVDDDRKESNPVNIENILNERDDGELDGEEMKHDQYIDNVENANVADWNNDDGERSNLENDNVPDLDANDDEEKHSNDYDDKCNLPKTQKNDNHENDM